VPGFIGIRFGVSKAISGLVDSWFYFLKETFDGVPTSVCLVSKSEDMSVEFSFQPESGTDEKHGVVDIVFHGEFRKKIEITPSFCVGNSLTWRSSFISGSAAAYSQ